MGVGDRDGGQCDVADDLSTFLGHDGKRQFLGYTQGTHDELLGMAGVRRIGEGGGRDRFDGGNVVGGFVSELDGQGVPHEIQTPIAMTQPTSPANSTTSAGGTRPTVSSPNESSASPKSALLWMALVHTGS